MCNDQKKKEVPDRMCNECLEEIYLDHPMGMIGCLDESCLSFKPEVNINAKDLRNTLEIQGDPEALSKSQEFFNSKHKP